MPEIATHKCTTYMYIVLSFLMSPSMCMSLIPAVSRHLGHQKLLKHPQNPYSIERVAHKLSKTPSHALIDAVGGSNHHFEYITPTFPAEAGPGAAKQDRKTSTGFPSRIADPPSPLPLMRHWGQVGSRLVRFGTKSARVVHSK